MQDIPIEQFDVTAIPGGAATQVGNTTARSGVPQQAVGLTPEQAQQARDQVTPPEPIPMWDEQNPPPQDMQSIEQQSPQESTEQPVEEKRTRLQLLRERYSEYDDLSDTQLLDAYWKKLNAEGYVPEGETKEGFYQKMGYVPITLTDISRHAGQGIGFAWTDEGVSLGVAFAAKVMGDETPFWEIYEDVWEAEQLTMERFSEAHPGVALGAELGGALATGKVGVKALELGAKTALGKSVAVGTSSGAIYGAGGSEEGGVGRLAGAAKGAAAGAVVGGVINRAAQIPRAVQKQKIKSALKSGSKAKDMNLKYESKYLRYMVEPDKFGRPRSSAEAHRLAREDLGLTVDEVYQLSKFDDTMMPRSVSNTADAMDRMVELKLVEHLPREASRDLIKGVDYLIRPIDSAILDLSPATYRAVQQAERRIYTSMHRWHNEVKPFRNAIRKLSKEDRLEVGISLYNRDYARAQKYLTAKFGKSGLRILEHLKATLETVEKDAKKAGIEFDTISDYFPRYIKDLKGLKKYLNSKNLLGEFDDLVMKQGGKLTPFEEAQLLNRYLESGVFTKGKVKKAISATKKRKVAELNAEMMKYYADPITSIDLHIRNMAAAIERRKFFGKNIKLNKENGLEDIIDSAGAYAQGQGLHGEQAKQLKDLIASRFGKGEQAGSKVIANARQITGGLTLGNPRSAVKQLGDILVVAGTKGTYNTIKAIPKAMWETARGQLGLETNREINADTMGWMLEMAQELDTGGVASNMVKKTAHALYQLGFRQIDRFGKNVTIQASINRAKKLLSTKKGTEQFISEYGGIFKGNELTKLIADIKANNHSGVVKDFIFNEVTRVQPITRSQMSQAYLDNPNARGLFQFKSWGLRQIDFVRTDVVRRLFSKNAGTRKEAAQQLMLLSAYLSAGGVGTTKLQQYISNQEQPLETLQDFSTEAFFALIGNFGVDRFSLASAVDNRGLDAFWKNYLIPPALDIPSEIVYRAYTSATTQDDLITTPFKDERMEEVNKLVFQTTGLMRWVDYAFLGGGKEWTEKKAAEKQQADRKRLMQ